MMEWLKWHWHQYAIVYGMAMFVGGFFCLCISATVIHGRYVCENYTQMTGTPTRYVPFDSCYLQIDDEWVRYDEYKIRFATKGME